ncbi:MAG: hypothetical protein M3Q56_05440 [Bacteroidota bacterium]|nr:hypothetical protein [Bacteroidota bacterium]
MKNYNTLFWLTVFSIAMGYLETSVVVYLRKIYYPAGFNFPLVPIVPQIAVTELLREAATIIMLAAISILAGKNKLEKFSFFFYCFAIWDLFYYLFLKILLAWPVSLLSWDILFLIPTPWLGPVLAPCLVSITFIIFTLIVLNAQRLHPETNFNKTEIFQLIIGGTLIVSSFMYTYLNEVSYTELIGASLLEDVTSYIPKSYNWFLFILGELVFIATIVAFAKRNNVIFSESMLMKAKEYPSIRSLLYSLFYNSQKKQR